MGEEEELSERAKGSDWRNAFTYWRSRWNDNQGAAAMSLDIDDFPYPGKNVMFVCGMGIIYVKPEDIPAFAGQMRAGLDMLEREYGERTRKVPKLRPPKSKSRRALGDH